ncbi:MAG: UDP-N-acetylglucosamine 2-epimerase (non-hydrolyzing) [Sphingobacteriaceae bacterium]|nr:UDP-N-acetylglucosamine 2-epimerase (non-hydrolyzing) [Sphingobacteriaceae bacterium]
MKIVTVIGARPQFIKASIVSFAMQNHGIDEVIIHTGQHYDPQMSDIFFKQMEIPKPKYILDVNGVGHGAMTGRMLEQIEEILLQEKPDYVLVYGDTNSTLAGVLAAKKLHMKVVHVEAGLRSFNMAMPEEINRILTDRISDYLFCPTQTAVNNLINEGYNNLDCKVELVGDVMYDCFLHFSNKQQKPSDINIANKYVLATIHRAENTDSPNNLTNIVTFLNKLAEGYQVILPLHPRTKKIIEQSHHEIKFTIIDPVGYLEMIWLLNNCEFVITDSGGLQKEAYFAKKKCITLRSETEWVELVESRWNILKNPVNHIYFETVDILMPESYNLLYGDGNSANLIFQRLLFNEK